MPLEAAYRDVVFNWFYTILRTRGHKVSVRVKVRVWVRVRILPAISALV